MKIENKIGAKSQHLLFIFRTYGGDFKFWSRVYYEFCLVYHELNMVFVEN